MSAACLGLHSLLGAGDKCHKVFSSPQRLQTHRKKIVPCTGGSDEPSSPSRKMDKRQRMRKWLKKPTKMKVRAGCEHFSC